MKNKNSSEPHAMIIFSIPTYWGNNDSWYVEHIWQYTSRSRVRFTICDADGNHEPIRSKEVEELMKTCNERWIQYSQWVVENNGLDPLEEFIVPERHQGKKTTRNVVVKFSKDMGHKFIVDHVCVGKQKLKPDDLPPGLYQYLCIRHLDKYRHFIGVSAQDLRDHGYLGDGYWKGKAEWHTTVPDDVIRAKVMKLAKRHLKENNKVRRGSVEKKT